MQRFNIQIMISFLAWTLLSCSPPISKSQKLNEEAPSSFKAKFETTKGDFIVEFHRDWSPLAVDRAHQLIKSGFYNNAAFFRIVENYVAQFGISNDSTLNSFWEVKKIEDEPVVIPNTLGTVSFARGGPQTRATQLFINLKNNSPRLDTLNYQNVIGFPVIGKLVEGEEILQKLYAGYGNTPSQDSIHIYGNKYLLKNFPELDYIKKVILIK